MVLSTMYSPSFHPYNIERNILNLEGRKLRPRDIDLPEVTQFVNDGSKTRLWLLLILKLQFLTTAPWGLERMGSRTLGLFYMGEIGRFGGDQKIRMHRSREP